MTDSAQSAEALRRKLVCAAVFVASLGAFLLCWAKDWLLLYGDAVAHEHIARRILDSHNPGLQQLGSVWLPFSHLVIIPFVARLGWWHAGAAAAIPSMLAYMLAGIAVYRLARLWLAPAAAIFAFCFFALNPGLLYLQTTAMTEPFFLCEVVWSALLLAEAGQALAAQDARRANWRILAAGLVLVAAVYTRYDGWIYASVCWLLPAGWMLRKGTRPAPWAFLLFTLILAAAPAGWLLYNARLFGDPLDFMRGPYSARAIELRTTPPGSGHYPGWHDVHLAWLYYFTDAALNCINFPLTYVFFFFMPVALGTAVWRERLRILPLLLLWVLLPFYIYSVSYGSVPIFMPQWRPNSWYNTRYGIELLPAFALTAAFALDLLLRWKKRSRAVLLAICFTLLGADYAAVLWKQPIVFQEAVVNSSTRIPFETKLAAAIRPMQGRILMSTTDHVGAVQRAGIPLARILDESDGVEFNAALKAPAAHAAFVVAMERDAVDMAVGGHAEGLTLIETICSQGQPCARIYRSDAAAAQTVPLAR